MKKFWNTYGGIIVTAIITTLFLVSVTQCSKLLKEIKLEQAPK
jgi:hypothetical protein